MPTLDGGHGAQDGGLPARGARRRAGTRTSSTAATRPGPTSAPARARTAPRSRSATAVAAMSALQRPAGAQADDANVRHAAARPGPRRAAPWSPTTPASPMWTCSAASRSTRSATPTRPSSTRSPSRSPRSATSPTSTSPSRRSRSPSCCSPSPAAPGGSTSATPARRRTRPRSSSSRRTGRTHVVAAVGGFHGRTMGALALTGQPAKSRPVPAAARPGVTHVPYGDVDGPRGRGHRRDRDGASWSRSRARTASSCRRAGYLAAARAITTKHGALLALDEVQTGIGRTGHWFAHQADGVEPDIVTLAKGLGGGLPIGACVAFGDGRRRCSGPGSHGSTFGGNPVSCAAALAVLRTIARDGLLDHVKRVGERLRGGIEALGQPAGRRGPRRRPAARHRAHRAGRRGDVARRAAATPASWPTRRSPT